MHPSRLIKILKKPPSYIFWRAAKEAMLLKERVFPPNFKKWKTEFYTKINDEKISELWEEIYKKKQPFQKCLNKNNQKYFTKKHKKEFNKILKLSKKVLNSKVKIFSSWHKFPKNKIVWNKDLKSNYIWTKNFFLKIKYISHQKKFDVKEVWELSRLQWLIPLGQSFFLTRNEKYAETTKKIILSWLKENPVGYTVNWAIAMEPAVRIVILIWLFYALGGSKAWLHEKFQKKFLEAIYEHAKFVFKYIEKSDINGNHFTANLVGLVAAGFFYQEIDEGKKWLNYGFENLEKEIQQQVTSEGINFEGSIAYHRFVAEMFLIGGLFARASGKQISSAFRSRLIKMGEFTANYSRKDGTSPLWGDADDGRILPLENKDPQNHQYLPGLIGLFFGHKLLIKSLSASRNEAFWLFGPKCANMIPLKVGEYEKNPKSVFYPKTGYLILKNKQTSLFFDISEVGLAGRGGHGHNDVLSFDLWFEGMQIFSDPGSFTYTRDFAQRNRFRSGFVHNGPIINRQEPNRFVEPSLLWSLHYDAKPKTMFYKESNKRIQIKATHSGYQRLNPPLNPIRTIQYDIKKNKITICDEIKNNHKNFPIYFYYQLGIGVNPQILHNSQIRLTKEKKTCLLTWFSNSIVYKKIRHGWVSPSYGVKKRAKALLFKLKGKSVKLVMEIEPK